MTGGNYGNGTSTNTFNYTDTSGNTYTRRVNATLNVITLDEEGGSLTNTNLAKLAPEVSTPFVQDHHDGQVRLPGSRGL